MVLTTSYQKVAEKYLGNSYGDVYIRIYAKYSSQSIANNTSTVQYQSRIYYGGNSYIQDGGADSYITTKGTNASDSKRMNYDIITQGRFGKGETTCATIEGTVTHNADGSKSVSCSAYAKFGLWGWSGTASGTADLPTIPRQANITAADNFTDEGNPTVTYSNPAGNAATALDIAIYNTAGSVSYAAYRAATKTATSYTFNLTTAERTALRKAATSNTLTVRFYLRTNIGGTNYYSSIDKTMTITNGNPTLNPTVVDNNSVTKALTGDANKLVKYYSNAYYTINAAAVKESSLSSQSVTHNGVKKTTATGTYNAVESASFSFEAKDSRGNTTTKTITKTLINYVKLTCNQKVRISAEGVATIEASGNYFNGSFGTTANTLTVQYRYKTQGGSYSSWTNMTATKSGNTYTASATKSGLNYQTTYVFQCRAIDKINTGGVNTEEKTIKSLPVFDWGENDFHVHGNLVVEGSITGNNATSAIVLDDEEGTTNPASDYIIEYGNNGSYAYRKWNSGLLEAWRSATSKVSVTSSETYGNTYYTTQTAFRTNGNAAQFVSLEQVQVTVNKADSIGFWQPVIAKTAIESNAATAYVFFTNPAKDVTASIMPYVYFIGRWK